VTRPPNIIYPTKYSMASYGISSYDVKRLETTVSDVYKSLSLKSYKIFHPNEPNFLLSSTIV
jgi:hypothetical protein